MKPQKRTIMETTKPITIHIKDGRVTHRISVKNLIYIHCDCYICTIITLNGHHYSCSKPLSYFTNLLQPPHFVRISRNKLINIEHVSAVKSGDKNRKIAIMSNGEELEIAFRRWRELKEALITHDV